MTVSRSNPLAPGRPRCSWHPPRPDRCAVDGGGTSIPVADFPVRSPAGVRLDPSPGFAPVPARGSKSTARLGGFGGCDWWSGTCFLSPHPRCGCGQAAAALGGMDSLEIRRWRAAGPFTPQCWRPRQICSTTLRVTCCHPCGRRRQRRAGCRGSIPSESLVQVDLELPEPALEGSRPPARAVSSRPRQTLGASHGLGARELEDGPYRYKRSTCWLPGDTRVQRYECGSAAHRRC